VRPPISSAKALRMMWGGTEMEITGHMCKYLYNIYIWYITVYYMYILYECLDLSK
jgi:hypothetical protein